MPLKYSCFISYPRDTGIVMTRFMNQLKKYLDGYIGLYLDERRHEVDKVYIDTEDSLLGMYEQKLANAICHSVCMIVIYTPTYATRKFCLREYKMMEDLEAARLSRVGLDGEGEGLIIPIVLRGQGGQLPERLTRHRQYCDFSKFMTASRGDISKYPKYIEEIEKIAIYILHLLDVLTAAPEDVCADCDERSLPGEDEVEEWPLPPPVFPWRAAR
jgi:hypothetical protein